MYAVHAFTFAFHKGDGMKTDFTIRQKLASLVHF